MTFYRLKFDISNDALKKVTVNLEETPNTCRQTNGEIYITLSVQNYYIQHVYTYKLLLK